MDEYLVRAEIKENEGDLYSPSKKYDTSLKSSRLLFICSDLWV